jgi:zinc protease
MVENEVSVDIAYRKVTLDNGLDVILHEDHDLPIVAVNLWYHVGSKNERPGRTGFAHLFEHLMFEGSAHHDKGFFPPLQEAGASLNGSTNADRTNYWEVVPNGALELALWLESDRMGFLLPALTQAKFDTQREVVINERRQNYENRPYGLAGMALAAAIYPPDHPYHWPTIGYTPDLRAATLEDVRAFFARYYHPANASIALAGDFDSDSALAIVTSYFEDIPAGPAVDPVVPSPNPTPGGEMRLVLEDRVELPRLYLSWRSPALFERGDAELDLVADVLANGKTSRLYRTLVHDRRMALDVSAAQQSRELEGLFQIVVTAAPGHDLASIDALVTESVEEVARDGPTSDEIVRGLAQAEAHFVYRLQTVGGFNGKSDQLNAYNVMRSNPGYFTEDLARYRRLQPADMQTASTALVPARRVALSVVPTGRGELALPGSTSAVVS